MPDESVQRGFKSSINYGTPFGPGAVINQLYHISLQLTNAINKKNQEDKWMLWMSFQKYHTRALKSAKNMDEELPIPSVDEFPDWYFEDDFAIDISDDMMTAVVQPVIDKIEKKLFQKGLNIHG